VVKSAGGVSLTLVDSQGAVLPVVTKIVTADGKIHRVVAFDGLAYLEAQRVPCTIGSCALPPTCAVPGA
jgi:hypothetical protein